MIQASSFLNPGPTRVRFNPAYSGGVLSTDSIGIPEALQVGEDVYPAGTPLPVVVDLSTATIEQNIPILYGHDGNARLGHTTKVETDGKQVTMEGVLSSPSEWRHEVVESAKAGARWQCSIGSGTISPTQKTVIKEGESVEVNGRTIYGPVVLVKGLRICEISLVPVGADPETEVLVGSAFSVNLNRDTVAERVEIMKVDFATWCQTHGFVPDEMDEANRTALEALWLDDTDQNENEEDTLTAEGDVGDETFLSREPKTDTRDKNVPSPTDVPSPTNEPTPETGEDTGDKNVPTPEKEEKVTASAIGKKIGEAIIKSLNSPSVHVAPSLPSLNHREVLQCSALQRLGVDEQWLSKNGYSPRVIEEAQKKDTGLHELMGETLKASGVKVDYRNAHELVGNYQQLLKASGISTKNFGDVNVFSPILDKAMRYKFERLEPIYTKLLRTRTVNDFNEVATVDFDTLGRAKDIPEGGDYPQVLLQSSGAKFAVTKQGITAGISFESQVSDDLGALDIVGDELVNAIADAQADKFWTLWYANRSTLFSGANAITKTLSVAGLSAMKKAFASKKNANGRFLNVPMKYLLVPPSLEDVALNLFSWKWGEANMSGNIHVGKYEVWTDPYLGTDGGYTGASDTGWYGIADPARYPLGERAVMKGYEAPRIKETWYDHTDTLNLRAMGTVGYHLYDTNVPGVYSAGTSE